MDIPIILLPINLVSNHSQFHGRNLLLVGNTQTIFLNSRENKRLSIEKIDLDRRLLPFSFLNENTVRPQKSPPSTTSRSKSSTIPHQMPKKHTLLHLPKISA